MTGLPSSALDYPLDPRCVADRPAEPRDDARLMVVERTSRTVTHARVRDLPQWLRAGDHLVLNRTRVMRARLMGHRVADDGSAGRRLEALLLHPRGDGAWTALIRDVKRFKPGSRCELQGPSGASHGDILEVGERDGDGVVVRLHGTGHATEQTVLARSGWTPLPPYIVRARNERHVQLADAQDSAWYQTVYAHAESAQSLQHGSVAAPTAGLHFTPQLLERVRQQGVQELEVELQVGPGTFKPVESESLSAHPMHQEWCSVPAVTLARLAELADARATHAARLVVVGTTAVRTLESLPTPLPSPAGQWSANTSLLIQPGHQFRFVDALLTNFHLPRSTLLALVGAFVGLDWLKELYADAQKQGYRFFSYGDAMLIV